MDTMIVDVLTVCPICGEGRLISVQAKDYFTWATGASVQVAFPYLSADEREMLISGICPTCWASMFGGE